MALYRARQMGINPEVLLNFVNRDASRVMSHGIPSELMRLQAESLGLLIIQKEVSWKSYERDFIETVSSLSMDGITLGVFGDIDLEEHRTWIENACAKANVEPVLPLWMEDQRRILEEFLSLGFKAVVVRVKPDLLDESWIGRLLDSAFVQALEQAGISPCGERGEYHTFVIDGPLFRHD